MLKARAIECWYQNNVRAVRGRTFVGRLGLPDIIGYVKATGVAVYCEIKTVNDRLSPDQHEFLYNAASAGAIALLALEQNGAVVLVNYMDYLKE